MTQIWVASDDHQPRSAFGWAGVNLVPNGEVWLSYYLEDLSEAACVGQPDIFDPDTHHHIYVGAGNACWMCDEARDICLECPVIEGCFKRARRTKESFMIMAGMAWTNGKPRDLRKRRR